MLFNDFFKKLIFLFKRRNIPQVTVTEGWRLEGNRVRKHRMIAPVCASLWILIFRNLLSLITPVLSCARAMSSESTVNHEDWSSEPEIHADHDSDLCPTSAAEWTTSCCSFGTWVELEGREERFRATTVLSTAHGFMTSPPFSLP